MHKPIISKFGENAFLLKWPSAIDAKMHDEIITWETFITSSFQNKLLEIVITYSEIAVYFKSYITLDVFSNVIDSIDLQNNLLIRNKPTTWFIPVCYNKELGWDIEVVAEHNNITPDQVSNLHAAQPYRVYFTGFLPGFLYLGGLHNQLATPRKETPRLKIPKGAVAIAGSQTGIYPQESPGGWQIIGQTPIEMFNLFEVVPSPFSPGDYIQFQSVSKDSFEEVLAEVEAGVYQIAKSIYL